MIRMVAAEDLHAGYVFSTDGMVVTSVERLDWDKTVLVTGMCHGIEKSERLPAFKECPIYFAG